MRLRFWRKPVRPNPALPIGIQSWWRRLEALHLVPPLASRVKIEIGVDEPLRITYRCFADRRLFNDDLSNAIAAGSEFDYVI